MRGPKTALIAAVVVTGVSATILRAQQMLAGSAKVAAASTSAAADPSLAGRTARQLLRNGLDYLNTYDDPSRALAFLAEASRRPAGLDDAERTQLDDGLARAREAAKGRSGDAEVVAASAPVRPKGRSGRPGALVLASAPKPTGDEPIRQMPAAPPGEALEPPAMDLPSLPPPPPAPADAVLIDEPPAPAAPPELPVAEAPPELPASSAPAPAPIPVAEPAREPEPAPLPEAPPVAPASSPEPIFLTGASADAPAPASPKPAPAPAPAPAPPPADLPLPAPSTEPLPQPEAPPELPAPAVPPVESAAPEAVPVAVEPPPVEATTPTPLVAEPPVADAPGPDPAPEVAPAPVPAAEPRPGLTSRVPSGARPVAPAGPRRFAGDPRGSTSTAAPAVAAEELPPLPPTSAAAASPVPAAGSIVEVPTLPGSGEATLRPEAIREIEEMARLQEEAIRRNPPAMPIGRQGGAAGGGSSTAGDTGGGSSSRLELPRAPSPTEPRPIRVIPVPDEFVPLPARQWDPNRKFWAAASTCHMPLYFQDAVLERYGQGVEQSFGERGRYFSYPLDDPRQSNQRNQLLQPLYSAGMFVSQIVALPYNLVVDPPWEAQYDLGYYRPGDRVPPDTYYLPTHGIGPPLAGRRY